jgi:hypothetical protein
MEDATEALRNAGFEADDRDIESLVDEMERLTGTRAYFESLILDLAIRNL